MSTRAWLDRLLAALDDVYENNDEDWGGSLELGHLRSRVVDDRLLTMRPVRFRSVALARIEAAGAALSFDHAIKRMYASFRDTITNLRTPFLSHLKKADGPPRRWGGNGLYWDVVVSKRAPANSRRSKFYRDPFVASS